jgi:hypothetical protein
MVHAMGWHVPRLKIAKAEIGPPFAKLTVERRNAEREILYPLFSRMSGKRAVLDFYARADQPYVTESIRDLREMLDETLDELGPDATSGRLLRQIRNAVHQYLSAVERAPHESDHVLFAPALRDLRTVIREVAAAVGDRYELAVAVELVEAMDEADARADPQSRLLYEDPIASFKALHVL